MKSQFKISTGKLTPSLIRVISWLMVLLTVNFGIFINETFAIHHRQQNNPPRHNYAAASRNYQPTEVSPSHSQYKIRGTPQNAINSDTKIHNQDYKCRTSCTDANVWNCLPTQDTRPVIPCINVTTTTTLKPNSIRKDSMKQEGSNRYWYNVTNSSPLPLILSRTETTEPSISTTPRFILKVSGNHYKPHNITNTTTTVAEVVIIDSTTEDKEDSIENTSRSNPQIPHDTKRETLTIITDEDKLKRSRRFQDVPEAFDSSQSTSSPNLSSIVTPTPTKQDNNMTNFENSHLSTDSNHLQNVLRKISRLDKRYKAIEEKFSEQQTTISHMQMSMLNITTKMIVEKPEPLQATQTQDQHQCSCSVLINHEIETQKTEHLQVNSELVAFKQEFKIVTRDLNEQIANLYKVVSALAIHLSDPVDLPEDDFSEGSLDLRDGKVE